MRPRRFAAENMRSFQEIALGGRFNEAAAIRRGKHGPGGIDTRAGAASMRPRRFAAENVTRDRDPGVHRRASLRPRRFAAENC